MTIALPNKCLTYLMYVVAALFATYVFFVISTIFFASVQTQLSGEIREREADIIALETKYYDAVSELNGSDPYALGYVSPTRVNYVAADGMPAFTRADTDR